MNRDGRRETAGQTSRRAVVQSDGLDDRVGQSPKAEKISADLGVSRAKFLPFNIPEGTAGFLGGLEHTLVLGG